MIKEIFKNFLELFKKPTTKLIELSKSETTKTILIKGAIICIIIPLISLISTVSSINKKYEFDASKYTSSYYTEARIQEKKDDLKKDKDEAMKKAELAPTYFKTAAITAGTLAVAALVLFLITKMLKVQHKYFEELSMVVNITIILTLGTIIGKILGLMYIPLGILAMFATYVFATYAIILAFRDSLEIEDADKLVLFTTLMFVVALVVAVIVICAVNGISLNKIDTLFKAMNSSSSLLDLY